MTVRSLFALLVCAAALLAGCSGGDGAPLAAETDEPLYVQAKQLMRQGRHQEALANYLKVIEKRGAQSAPESHFEVGLICLTQVKNQVEAIHHFQAYLEQKPNSPDAARVRDLINTAKREYLKTLLGRSPDEYLVKAEGMADLDQLRKENDELRAQLATLRGGAAPLPNRPSRGLLALDNSSAAQAASRPAAADDSPLQMHTPPRSTTASRPLLVPLPASINSRQPTTPASVPAGRRHKVAKGETLWAIAQKFDATNTSKKMRDIIAANPQVFPDGNINALPLGAELIIP